MVMLLTRRLTAQTGLVTYLAVCCSRGPVLSLTMFLHLLPAWLFMPAPCRTVGTGRLVIAKRGLDSAADKQKCINSGS